MINLTSLPKIVAKKRKRVGRGYGSGVGAKSRRGTTRHQSAREKIKIEYEGGQNKMTKKFPLLRGKGKNKSLNAAALAIRVEKLNILPNKTEVTVKVLMDSKIIQKTHGTVKIVAGGKLEKLLIVKLPVSEGAKNEIEKAGGSVTTS